MKKKKTQKKNIIPPFSDFNENKNDADTIHIPSVVDNHSQYSIHKLTTFDRSIQQKKKQKKNKNVLLIEKYKNKTKSQREGKKPEEERTVPTNQFNSFPKKFSFSQFEV